MDIIKADGTQEPFDESKLESSLRHSEATEEDIKAVLDEIRSELKPGMHTEDIYKHAFEVLKRRGGSVAARYSMRNALAQLGPSGYPFEQFLGQIFEHQGYSVEIGVILEGKCVEHEIDVVARKGNEIILVEAKFHNRSRVKSDLKTALYISARHRDLEASRYGTLDVSGKNVEFWLVTNTKFTHNAIKYGKCAGVKLVGWTYPHENNLHDMVEEADVHPITAITRLTPSHKQALTTKGVVLCKQLRDHRETLNSLGLSDAEVSHVMNEVNGLCHL